MSTESNAMTLEEYARDVARQLGMDPDDPRCEIVIKDGGFAILDHELDKYGTIGVGGQWPSKDELQRQDMRDAERYRTLRRMPPSEVERLVWQCSDDDELDAAIDAYATADPSPAAPDL